MRGFESHPRLQLFGATKHCLNPLLGAKGHQPERLSAGHVRLLGFVALQIPNVSLIPSKSGGAHSALCARTREQFRGQAGREA